MKRQFFAAVSCAILPMVIFLVPSSAAAATYASGTVTITGTEGKICVALSPVRGANGANVTPQYTCSWVYDAGNVKVIVNGFTATATYGRSSTTATIASSLTTSLNSSSSPVTATLSGSTITLTSKQAGSGGDYALSANSSTGDPADFPGPSFQATPSGSALTGGYDDAPATPAGLTATAGAGGTTAAISWMDVSNETSYTLERCAGTNCTTGFASVNGGTLAANTVSYNDSALTQGTTYGYRIKATNSAGDSPYSSIVYVTMPSAPSTPSGLIATAGTNGTTAAISWTDVSNETSYTLERCTGTNCTTGFASVNGDTLAANTTSYNDTGLTPGTTYGYRIKATNAVGDSAYSNVVYITTPSAPVTPTGLTATPAANGLSVTLSWTDNANNETGYDVERCTGSACLNFSALDDSLPTDSTSYTDSTTAAGTTYRYQVSAVNAVGSSAYATTPDVTTPSVPAITGLSTTTSPVGSSLTISGTDFGDMQGMATVGGVPLENVTWAPTSISGTIGLSTPTGTQPVTVTTADSSSSESAPLTVLATPVISGVSPDSGVQGDLITISGVHFGNTQGTGTVTIGSDQAFVRSWSDTSIDIMVPVDTGSRCLASGQSIQLQSAAHGVIPMIATSCYPSVVVTTDQGSSNGYAWKLNFQSGFSFLDWEGATNSINLTTGTAIDWIHWGTDEQGLVTRMANGNGSISDVSVLGTAAPTQFTDGEIQYSWSDGSPQQVVNRTTSGLSVSGAGNGFHLSVPIDSTYRELDLTVGVWEAKGDLCARIASVPNSSACAEVDIVPSNADHHQNVTFRVPVNGSLGGTSVDIDFVLAKDYLAGTSNAGSISIQSAVLTAQPPEISFNDITDGTTDYPGPVDIFNMPGGLVLQYPSSISIYGEAYAADGNDSSVTVSDNGGVVLQSSGSSYSSVLSGLTPGDHRLQAAAVDDMGATGQTTVLMALVQPGGSIIGSESTPASIDISSGASDWVHWGLADDASVDRKAGITAQISSFTMLGGGAAHQQPSPTGGVSYSWTGGNPTDSQSGTATGLRATGYWNGFQLTVPADTTLRTLNFYVGSGQGQSTLRAALSDGSAAPFIYTDENPDAYDGRLYTIQFQAASAGQTLTITDQVTRDDGFAFVTLESATVVDINPPVIQSIIPLSGPPGTSVQIFGQNFGSQESSSVSVNGVPMQTTAWGDSAVTAVAPPNGTTGPIVVSRGLANSNGVTYQYPTLQSLSISPANASITVGSSQQFIATGTYSDGSNLDLTSTATWTSSETGVVVFANVASVQGIGIAANPGTATISAAIGDVTANSPVSVITAVEPIAPSIISVSPPSGLPGTTSVTISGSGFGEPQAGGSVWIGTAPGNITYWSDTEIDATVAPGSGSGVVEVQQGGLWSNSVPFAVNGPTIASIDRSSGVPGDTVTISGSGFGLFRGDGQVWLGSVPAVVQSWSEGTITAKVADGSTSGVAQVLQNSILSNAVEFDIDLPHIASVSTNSGTPGASVTIYGSGFGSTQGTVWLGSTWGTVSTWSQTQIEAIVANNSTNGTVRVNQGGMWSNALPFAVPISYGTTGVTLQPSQVSMVVGETRTLQALDSNGNLMTGLIWSSSDTNVLTLSADDPPVLSAIAQGHATISAGDGSADITVYPEAELPLGTVRWSTSDDGSGIFRIVPAVPSLKGVADVFGFHLDGTVQAIRQDGTTAWTANIGVSSLAIPDFQGGLVIQNGQTITKLDGVTGQPYPSYVLKNPSTASIVAGDGTILLVDDGSVVGIDPMTGRSKFSIPMEQSVTSGNGNCGEYPPFEYSYTPELGAPIIGGDGYAYFPYEYDLQPLASNQKICGTPEVITTHTEIHSRVLQIAMDGSYRKISIGDWAQDTTTTCVPGGGPIGGECSGGHYVTGSTGTLGGGIGTVISNSNQGVLYSWTNHLTTITNGNVVADVLIKIPSDASLQPILQTGDGSYIGELSTPSSESMVKFDTSGNMPWLAPNLSPQVAIVDGGVVAQSFSGQSFKLDSNGNVLGLIGIVPTQSWTNNSYAIGSIDQIVSRPLTAVGYWAFVGGNASGNNAAMDQQWFPPLEHCTQTPGCIGPYDALYNALDDLVSRLQDPTVSSLAQANIFDRLGNDVNGNKITSASFIHYLTSQRPEFYNGLSSSYCNDALAPRDDHALCNHFPVDIIAQTVGDYLASDSDVDGVTGTPSYPMLTFFRVTVVGYHSLGRDIGNEATIFHEALHGMTGKFDYQILDALGMNSNDHASCSITLRIEHAVLSQSANLDKEDTWDTTCPAVGDE